MGLPHFGRTLIQWRCQSRRLRDKDFDRRDGMSSGWTPPSPEKVAAARQQEAIAAVTWPGGDRLQSPRENTVCVFVMSRMRMSST